MTSDLSRGNILSCHRYVTFNETFYKMKDGIGRNEVHCLSFCKCIATSLLLGLLKGRRNCVSQTTRFEMQYLEIKDLCHRRECFVIASEWSSEPCRWRWKVTGSDSKGRMSITISVILCRSTGFSEPLLSNSYKLTFNLLNSELNPMCCLLALLGAHRFLHVSRIRVKSLTFRRLSYIYIYIWSTHSWCF